MEPHQEREKERKKCIVLVTQGGQGLLVHHSLMSKGLAEEATSVRPEKKRTKPDKGQPSYAGSPAGLALGLEASLATSLAANGLGGNGFLPIQQRSALPRVRGKSAVPF